MPLPILVLLSGLLLSFTAHGQTVIGAAGVVSLQGVVEYQASLGAAWQPVRINQKLLPGHSLRTGPHSRAALLLDDNTQVRLHEKTVLVIQAVEAKPLSAGQTKFRQLLGRAWVQSKTPPRQLIWQTPTAVAGLRGTDWEMQVGEDGSSLLSVFSGEVDLSNDFGRVAVAANEQAQAVQGKAPVKLVVQNLKERVQWVSAYPVEPLRHVALDGDSLPGLRQRLSESSDNDPATRAQRGRMLADLGRWSAAEQQFSTAVQARPDDAEALLGLAYVALQRNDAKAAAEALQGARTLNHTADWRYADIARMLLEQDHGGALAALQQATRQPDPAQPAPWLLLSDLAAFEGDTEAALAQIEQGLRQFPDHPRLYAQQARLLLWADRADEAAAAAEQAIAADLSSHDAWLARADIARREGDAATALSAYDLAISLKPDDAQAWYGRGVALGEREYLRQARDDLAQALALNPSGIGYQGELGGLETQAAAFDAADAAYRAALAANPADFVALTGLGVLELKRGRPQQALEALLKAGVMEPRYARVHVHTATAYYQMGQVKQAEQELARASELDDKDPLPYFMAAMIRSDQFRPAAAIDAARQAMQRLPYLKSLNQLANDQQGSANLGQAFAFMGMEEWARDYAQDSYNPFWAGSHLFLADRYNGLFTRNSELFQGLLADPVVFGAGNRFKRLTQAPGVNLDLSLRYSRSDSLDGFSPQLAYSGYRAAPKPMAWYLGYENVNWDLLDRPYDLNVFTAALGIKPRFDQGLFVFADASRQDSQPVGSLPGFGNYDLDDRLDTRRLDIGFNHQFSPVSQLWLKAGYFSSQEDTAGNLFGFSPIEAITDVKLPELALRHSFKSSNGHQISWGIDWADRKTDAQFDDIFLFSLNDYQISERSFDVYLSDTYQANDKLSLQGDLAVQQQKRKATTQNYFFIRDPFWLNSTDSESMNKQQLSPRLGLVYSPDPQTRIRFAYQNWLRPSGMSSLGPVATAGIPLDDRLVSRGGELHRARLQGDWEASPSTFITAHLDYKDIDNNRFSIRPFAVSELESLGKLRPRDYGQLMRDDPYEFVDTPDYAGGVIRSAGFAVNRMLTAEWATIARYVLTDSRNATDSSLMVPYLPRHTLSVGATWINPNGWYLAGLLTHRSHRYADEANTDSLGAGISGDLDVFRESRDKRWLLRFSANDLFDRERDSQYTAELNYRF